MLHDDPVIHPRISRRHPEIEVEDVAAAWENGLLLVRRDDGSEVWVSVGVDGRGRLLELVSVLDMEGRWLIFHAMTPPSRKTLRELGAERRRG